MNAAMNRVTEQLEQQGRQAAEREYEATQQKSQELQWQSMHFGQRVRSSVSRCCQHPGMRALLIAAGFAVAAAALLRRR